MPFVVKPMFDLQESPLTKKIRYVLTHAREAFTRDEQFKRKFDTLPNGLEIHIQFTAKNELKLALARVGQLPQDEPSREKFARELTTVLNHWPEPDTLQIDTPTYTEKSDRYWIITTLRIATQLTLL